MTDPNQQTNRSETPQEIPPIPPTSSAVVSVPSPEIPVVAETKSWWTDTKKFLQSQFLTIILTPLTIFWTMYFTELNKKANASIEEGESVTYYSSITGSPSKEIRQSLKADSKLYNNFLVRLEGLNPVPKSSKSWLNDNGDWDENCQGIYKDIALGIKTDVAQFLSDDILTSRLPPSAVEKSKNSLEILNLFLNEIDSIDHLQKTPSGKVVITLGILNKTSYDGLIYDDVLINFSGKSFHITSDSGFAQLKPHSLQKFSFTTFDLSDDGKNLYKSNGYGEQTKFVDSTESGKNTATIMKEFAKLVKNKKEIPITIIITVDGKKLPEHRAIIKYSDD